MISLPFLPAYITSEWEECRSACWGEPGFLALKPPKSLIFIWRDVKWSSCPQRGGNLSARNARKRAHWAACLPVEPRLVRRSSGWAVPPSLSAARYTAVRRSGWILSCQVTCVDRTSVAVWWFVVIFTEKLLLVVSLVVDCCMIFRQKYILFGAFVPEPEYHLLVWRNVTVRVGLYAIVNVTNCFFRTFLMF
jgi:hypothetical protein